MELLGFPTILLGLYQTTVRSSKIHREIRVILDAYHFLVFASDQEGTKVDLPHLEKHVRLLHRSHYHEVLHYLLGGNLELPVALVRADQVWSILEHHLRFLTAQDSPLLAHAPEEARIRTLLFVYLFPLEVVGQACGIYYVEPLCVFDLGT